jgi:hypothetical protein
MLDVVVLVLAGLTGPFALLLLPVALGLALVRRGMRSYVLLALVTACSVAQLVTIVSSPRGGPESLGATVGVFSRIVVGRAVLGPVLGRKGFLSALTNVRSDALWFLLLLGCAIFVVAVLWTSSANLRLLVGFGALCLLVGLFFPLTGARNAWWGLLQPNNGGRYFVIPMFTILLIVGAAIERRSLLLRTGAGLFVVVSLFVGIPNDWTYPQYTNFHYQRYVRVYEHLQKGDVILVPENPPGWRFGLIKS